jgi:hypothetical protein
VKAKKYQVKKRQKNDIFASKEREEKKEEKKYLKKLVNIIHECRSLSE